MATRPVYFDCDTGIDDALALVYLMASPEISLAGIGTVSGTIAPPMPSISSVPSCAAISPRHQSTSAAKSMVLPSLAAARSGESGAA